MKKNQINDIVKGGATAIRKEIATLQVKLTELKLKTVRGEVKNVRENKITRRTIARLLTAKEML